MAIETVKALALHLPQALPAAVHRDQAVFADLQHRTVTRGRDRSGSASAFHRPVHGFFGRVVMQNRAERQEVGIRAKHNRTVNTRDVFQHRRGNVENALVAQ